MRRAFRRLTVLCVIGVLIANIVGESLAPRFVRATETGLTSSLLQVVPVSQNGSVVGFDLSAEGKVVAPIRLSSNGLITATTATITTDATSQTLTITGLRCKSGAGVVFAPSDFVSVTVTEGEKYPVVHFQLTLVEFDPAAWKSVAGNCPFHFLMCSLPDATIWQQQGWGMATPKLDPYTLHLDDDNGNWQVATKYNRDWSYVVPMGASPIPVIGLWNPDASHYVGFFFQGARLLDHTERYVAASYCWKQEADKQFITLAYPYGGKGYQDLMFPEAGDSVASWFDLLWSSDMAAWKEPNQLCQDVTFSKYAASLPTVPQQNDLAYVPGDNQRQMENFPYGDYRRSLLYRTTTPTTSWFEPIGVEVGSLFVEGWGSYRESAVQAAFDVHDTESLQRIRNELKWLLDRSKWLVIDGDRCLVWDELLEGDWKPGYTPGSKNLHTSDWFVIGSYMVDMYRNDGDPYWLPWIDGMYNWSRHYLYTRNDLHDVPSSPFSIAASTVCPFLVVYANTFRYDTSRATRAEDALSMARSYVYRSMAIYAADNDPNDSIQSDFLAEAVSGQGWTGGATANEVSMMIDTMALVYANTGDARLKYYLRGFLEHFYLLYREQAFPVASVHDYGSDALSEVYGLFDGGTMDKGRRISGGWAEPLALCFPVGQSSVRVLCGPSAAISFQKGGNDKDIAGYRCNPCAGFSFNISSGDQKPFSISLNYPTRDIHAMVVKRIRNGTESVLAQGGGYESFADAPSALMIHGVIAGDTIVVGDVSNAVACQPADLPLNESVLMTSTDSDNYRMVVLPYTTSVSADWNDNDSFAGLLPGKQNAWGVPYYIQPPTIAPGKVAASGNIQLPSVAPEYTDAYVIYSPNATKDNVSLVLADGTSMTYTDAPVSAWHSWPENFHQRLVMAHFSYTSGEMPVSVEAGANLVFAVTLGKNITPTQLSWYDNGLTAARTQAAIDDHYAIISGLVASRIGDQRIALIPPVTTASLTAYRMGGLLSRLDVISDQQFVDPNVFNAATYPVALYTGVEDYVRTVTTDGDGEQAIQRYLSQGGVLVFAVPMGGNWPMYYAIDNGVRDDDDPLLPRLGIPMYGPWESPPGPLTVNFSAMQEIITGLPLSFPFPTSGDLRLRLADLTRVGPDVRITPILAIDGLGSPAFLAKFVSGPMRGGQMLYIWSRFLDQSYSDTIYESVIKFIADQYTAAPASLTATVTDNKVVLTWPAGIPGNHAIAGYSIYRSDTSGKYASTPTATVDASTLTWTDAAPAAGTNSYYIVRALDSGTPARTSGSSPEASVITAFRVSSSAGAHGVLAVPDALLPRSASTTVAIHPAQGWSLSALLDNSVDVTSSVTAAGYVINDIQADHVLTATFAAIPTFILTPAAGTGGTITPGAPQTVRQGEKKSFAIAASLGYRIANVTVDGVSQGAISSYAFTNVAADHAIHATFEEEKKQTVLVLRIGSPTLTANDSSMMLDSPPVIKNGRTLVPIRAIIEALGGTVGWDGTARKATVTLGSTSLELGIGRSIASINGADTPIDSTNTKVVPEIINGRTMLPLRFVTENLGATVSWDQSTQTITITYQP